MAGQKKFGAFAGVFTPSILTILGVIMYMRMGWVVGNAGLVGAIIIIVIAHVISVSTGLSLSSIATDKKVGAGGIYYILSRSMGIPIGGAIGITLYIGTAFSIALYLIGFAESFNDFFGFATDINGLRVSGSIGLLVLTIIALISTSFALKTQFFILAAIVVSLFSIFFGTQELAPESVVLLATDKSVPLDVVFAIFFPAVTGFTAGVAMSGDLKDPKKSLPVGTIAAIAIGFIVYIGLAFFLAYTIDGETLRGDYNILQKIAVSPKAVMAGIWGATLSSALGGILGGPRILQAMSIDKITPKVFGKGKGKSNEPVNALILVFVIAFAGILIGQLDVIARVVSMFYLAAYGFINLAFFLESWANPDFQPTFKVNRWFGLLGFLASFAIMFKLDSLAMFGAIVIIVGIFFWLQRKQIQLDSGDVWHSVWENVVAKGLKRIDAKDTTTTTNWNPNIILFSGESKHRKYLLELGNTISGNTGIVTNFKLILDKTNENPLTKTEQVVKDASFKKLGIYGRQVKVDNIYRGIENIASTFGFSGVEPNTIMMGWPKELRNSKDYSIMTQKLIHLDYNLLYLDFDQKEKFGKYQSVDLWWRETDNKNAEMMLNIVRFIIQSEEWNKAKIRVLFVNHNNVENNILKSKIEKLVDQLRVNVEIKVINNGVEQKAFYDIIALQSASTDLTILGIPDIKTEKQADFVLNTNQLFETIGSTLLIKASDNFNELELNLNQKTIIPAQNTVTIAPLVKASDTKIDENSITLDSYLSNAVEDLTYPALSAITNFYGKFIENIYLEFNKTKSELPTSENQVALLQDFMAKTIAISEKFRKNNLQSITEVFDKGINKLLNSNTAFVANSPKFILSDKGKKIKWKPILGYYFFQKILPNTQSVLYDFGVRNFMLLNDLTTGISKESHLYLELLNTGDKSALENYNKAIRHLLDRVKIVSSNFETQTSQALKSYNRDICNKLSANLDDSDFFKKIKKRQANSSKKKFQIHRDNLTSYATDWHRNQVLAHQQYEAGLHLSRTGLALTGIHSDIIERIGKRIITPLQLKIETLQHAEKEFTLWTQNKEVEHYTNRNLDEITEGIVHVNFNTLLESEEETILGLSPISFKTVSLLSSASFNEFFKTQNETVTAIDIELSNIQNYIIQTSYLAPLQEVVLKLETAFNQNSEAIYNTANRLKHVIDTNGLAYLSTKEKNDNNLIIDEVHEGIKKDNILLNKLFASFKLDLKSNLQHTTDNLDIRTIIDSAELLSRAAKKPTNEPRFKNWIASKKEVLKHYYEHILHFIIQRQDDIERIKFEETHHKYTNIIEQTASFINTSSISPKAKKALPFYYKKLFTGSHVANTSIIRKTELETARKSIARIDTGINAAIMIIGKSQSGKSFLTEAVAKIPENATKYYINPPTKQTYTAADMHLAFQKTFDKKGTSLSIIKQLKSKSIFIFNDIERWWIKSEKGGASINYLANLIEKQGSNHYFILNCNLYSYHILKQTTTIERHLLSTIITRPANKVELAEIILNRHKIGGASIYHKGDLVFKSNQLESVFADLHQISNGNIGVALHIWLTAIKLNTEGELSISKPKKRNFPSVNNAKWKVLLYQFILHKTLNENKLTAIFKTDKNWALQTLADMKKAGLIENTSNNSYELKVATRYFIEKKLRAASVL